MGRRMLDMKRGNAIPSVLSRGSPGMTTTSQRPGRRSRPMLERRQARVGALFVLPAFVVVAAFFLVPLGFAIYVSLTNWTLIGAYHFVGLNNYVKLVHDSVFLHSILFTLEYTAIVTPLALLLSYGLAVLVRRRIKGVGFFRTVYFLPTAIGFTAISYMAVLEFQPNFGGVDWVLSKLDLAGIGTPWLANSALALLGIVALVVWANCGLTMLILMSGMQAIPDELYQAADVDGAGRWAKELRLTIPLLRRSFTLCLVISVIGSLVAFNQFYILTSGGPGTSTTTVVMWVYQVAFGEFHLGYATAMSLVLLVIVAAVTAGLLRLLRSDTE